MTATQQVEWVKEQLLPIVGGQRLNVVLFGDDWMGSGLSFYVATVTSFPLGESSVILVKLDNQLFFVQMEPSGPWSRLRVISVRAPDSPDYEIWCDHICAYYLWHPQTMRFAGKARTEVDFALFDTIDISHHVFPALQAAVRAKDMSIVDPLMTAAGQPDCRRLLPTITEVTVHRVFPLQDHCVESFCYSRHSVIGYSGRVDSMTKITLCIYKDGWRGKREVLAEFCEEDGVHYS